MSLPVAKSPHAVMVEDWLFLVLRYAVSREARDRRAVLDLAAKMDTLGKQREREMFRFFRSHSERLCTAIATPDMLGRRQILMAHARRIGQRRLQQAFLLTCRLESREKSFRNLAEQAAALSCGRDCKDADNVGAGRRWSSRTD